VIIYKNLLPILCT